MRTSELPIVGYTCWESAGKDRHRLHNYWYQAGRWYAEPLFQRYRLPKEGEIKEPFFFYEEFSTNYRYFYSADIRTYFGIVGVSKQMRILKWTQFECFFSPNSRWLAGLHEDFGDKIAIFRMPDCKETVMSVRPQTFAYEGGWYPDSRWFWYGSYKGWFRVDVTRLPLRPERLTKQEYERLYEDWDLLNPRFRTIDATLHERKLVYKYSWNGSARAQVQPEVYNTAAWARHYGMETNWQPQRVIVQRRSGKQDEVLHNRDERVRIMGVSAVSDDGLWVIVAIDRWDEAQKQQVYEWGLYSVLERRERIRWTGANLPGQGEPYWRFDVGSLLRRRKHPQIEIDKEASR